jgi:hypothetical protein
MNMDSYKDIPINVREISLHGIQRVVAGLESNWDPTMVTVWARHKRRLGFSEVIRTHATYKPSRIQVFLLTIKACGYV